MALASNRDLQRLADPPRRVSRQPSAMANVKTVDRLHEAANGLLEQVGVAQRVVPETLGNVGRQTDVGRCQAVLEMDVAVMQTADGQNPAGFGVAVFADELGHRPGFERRSVGAQTGEMADEV